MWFTKLGGRRFVLTFGCGLACTGLVWFAKITDATFGLVIIATVGAYIAGNTYQKTFSGPNDEAR